MPIPERDVDPRRLSSLDALADPAVYTHYRRLFASGLARLARRGLAAPPDEGLDLIHGFFVDKWSTLAPQHDPKRAAFDTYIYGCFLNYARPRIVRLQRARSMLVDPASIERATSAPPAPEYHEAEPVDLQTVRDAIGGLSALGRLILLAYLSDDTPSERELAAKLGLTRYELRMQLSNAMVKTMIAIGELSVLPPQDRLIAQSLFRDGRTVRATAKLLQLDAAQIQKARARWLGLLIQSVKGKSSMTSHVQSQPKEASAGAAAAGFLEAALRPDAGAEAEAAIRANREAIWLFLEGPEAVRVLARYGEADPARLARVYELLADDANQAVVAASGEYDAMLAAMETEDASIGEAFEVLMSGLSADAAEPWRYVRHLSGVSDETYGQLHQDPSVRAAGAVATDFVQHGITPGIVAEASSAVSKLANRYCRDHAIEISGRIILDSEPPTGRAGAAPTLTRREVVDNLARGIELPRAVLEKLYDWMLDAASQVPLFFDGFETHHWDGRHVLTRTGRTEPDLLRRWNVSMQTGSGRERFRMAGS